MWCTTRFYFRAVTVSVNINDLPECLKNIRPRLFADGTNFTASSHSIADIEIAANSDLENLRHWLIVNKLSLNVAKIKQNLC